MFLQIVVLFTALITQSFGIGSIHPKLLIVSFDGFRYDYFGLGITPVLSQLRAQGTTADYLDSVFPTQTFPNHFSIATGLYPEIHGVLGNSLYDPVHKIVKNYKDLWSYNPDIRPFWSVNEEAGGGRHSGTMMWPGGELPYGGRRPTFYEPWKEEVPWETRVNRVISWFMHPRTPANVVFLYFENPDEMAHAYGPNSSQNVEQVARADRVAGYLMNALRRNRLTDVNTIFLSDHGIMGTREKNIIDVQAQCGNKCQMFGTSPFRQVLPVSSDSNSVYMKLKEFSEKNKNFQVFKKEDIPEKWHIKKCQLTLPIVLLAKPGYAFEDLYKSIDWYKKHFPHILSDHDFGVHGYDPSEPAMKAFFIAIGPLFKEKHTVKPFINIDFFSLFAKIQSLNLPSVKPNGTFANVKDILKGEGSQENTIPQ